ncbi:proteasome subunit beta type 6 [Reticulomyxa filosa]|uniref:Proteasome subunit beta type 6 n=1 Tax=Reticulomyxa filosa TaxID=46433 RepID=X6P9W1_RETFI|nr:proteasome subunit beta type 6 [Reticulomyxa filosa]|eukprot:ETO34422.1 proteasome subunit beta type 6 [Reticulomyxa filosa]
MITKKKKKNGILADTQNIGDYVAYYLKQLSSELNESPRVELAAKTRLEASVIISGWDKYKGGQVYEVTLGGTQFRKVSYSAGGSGSAFIFGYCDSMFKNHEELYNSAEKCKQFAIKALSLALLRDTSSDGLIRLAVVTKKGVQRETIKPLDPLKSSEPFTNI